MPIYEYLCNECGTQFELLQKISDVSITKCEQCDNENVKRLVSATTFRLKGSGWYETDFKNNKKSEPAKTTSKETKKDKPKVSSTTKD